MIEAAGCTVVVHVPGPACAYLPARSTTDVLQAATGVDGLDAAIPGLAAALGVWLEA